MFLANYSGGLSDVDLEDIAEDGRVRAFRSSERANIWINGGYFLSGPRSSTTCTMERNWCSSRSSG